MEIKDTQLLLLFHKFFGFISKILVDKDGCCSIRYTVTDIYSLHNVIVPFFRKYPLRTTKYYDFLDFAEAVELIYNKEHLTPTGKEKLRLLKNQMNTLRTLPVDFIPLHADSTASEFISMDPNYLSGFTAAEGCFYTVTNNAGSFGSMRYQLVQHINNVHILKESAQLLSLKDNVISYEKRRPQYAKLTISDRTILHNNIISFFNKYPLYGVKVINLAKLQDILLLMKNQSHLQLGKRGKPWKPEVKTLVIFIVNNDTSTLLGDCTLGEKGWQINIDGL